MQNFEAPTWLDSAKTKTETRQKHGSFKKNRVGVDPGTSVIQMIQAKMIQDQLVKLAKQSYRIRRFLVVISFVAFCFGAAEQQQLWNQQNEPDEACDGIKKLITILSIITAIAVLRKHSLTTKQQKLMGQLPKDSTMLSSGNLRLVLFEAFFNMVHAPAYIHRFARNRFRHPLPSCTLTTIIAAATTTTTTTITTSTTSFLQNLPIQSGNQRADLRVLQLGCLNDHLSCTACLSFRAISVLDAAPKGISGQDAHKCTRYHKYGPYLSCQIHAQKGTTQ
jgi:hypothetical protein